MPLVKSRPQQHIILGSHHNRDHPPSSSSNAKHANTKAPERLSPPPTPAQRRSPTPEVAASRTLTTPAFENDAGDGSRQRSTSLGEATPRPSAISLLPHFVRPHRHHHHHQAHPLSSVTAAADVPAEAAASRSSEDDVPPMTPITPVADSHRRPSTPGGGGASIRPDALLRRAVHGAAEKDDGAGSPSKPVQSRQHSYSDAAATGRPFLRPLYVQNTGGSSRTGSGLSPSSVGSARWAAGSEVSLTTEPEGLSAISRKPGERSMSLSAGSVFGGAAPAVRDITVGLKPGEAWGQVVRKVLAVFNGDAPKGYIEDLNDQVSQHLRRHISDSPSRAVVRVTRELTDLFANGMISLEAKLDLSAPPPAHEQSHDDEEEDEDERTLRKLVSVWAFFIQDVMPFIEAAFLPLQTDPSWLAIERKGKGTLNVNGGVAAATTNGVIKSPSLGPMGTPTIMAGFSPHVGQHSPDGASAGASSALDDAPAVDPRKLALIAFRDHLVLPLQPVLLRLYDPDNRHRHHHRRHHHHSSSHRHSTVEAAGPEGSASERRARAAAELDGRKLQMASVLTGVQTADDRQAAVEALAALMRAALIVAWSADVLQVSGGGKPGGGGGSGGAKDHDMRRRGWIGRKKTVRSKKRRGVTMVDGVENGIEGLRSPLSPPGAGTGDEGEWRGDWGVVGLGEADDD